MKDGFIKVAAATPHITVADTAANAAAVIEQISRARTEQARLLVLPELCITGYTCGDLFLQPTLLQGALDALAEISAASAHTDMLIVVGLPLEHKGKLYNCAAVLQNGRILAVVPKTHLPNYNEFYELRHFTPAPEENTEITICGQTVPFAAKLLLCCTNFPGLRLGVEICEDLWAPLPPSVALALGGATVIANLSAGNELVGKAEYRRRLVCGQSARLVCGYIYAGAGAGESSTDMIFAGHNIIAENGKILTESQLFATGLVTSELDCDLLEQDRRRMNTFPAAEQSDYTFVPFTLIERDTPLSRPLDKTPFVPADNAARTRRCDEILTMQSHALAKRLQHTNSRSAVIGISGGLDSCLALLVAVRAFDLLGRDRRDIIAVTMPCFGTSSRTRANAEELCRALGVSFREVDITAAVRRHLADIGHDESQHDVVYENAQARTRTLVLMDIANGAGGLVIGTGDLSELALGWSTYNGDHMSMYGVNAGVPKTLVRSIVAAVAEEQDGKGENGAAISAVLRGILDTPVSPELLPPQHDEIAQKTEDLVGPYELHDFFLYQMIRFGFTPRKIFRLACRAFADDYDKATILHWLKVFYRRFFAQQFKRSCLPDGPKIGSVALSPRGDWRMPSDAQSALWLAELDKITL